MSGCVIIRNVLKLDPLFSQLVDDTNIHVGDSAIELDCPAVILRLVSGVPRNTICQSGAKQVLTERIQVSLICNNVKELDQLRTTLRRALNGVRGDIAGLKVLSVVADSYSGSTADLDTSSEVATYDYFVTYLN